MVIRKMFYVLLGLLIAMLVLRRVFWLLAYLPLGASVFAAS